MPVTASEALIDLSLTERAISDADARKLRGHVVKTNADAPTVERLLVRHHQVPPERARALRQRAEANLATPAPAPAPAPAPVDDAPALPPAPAPAPAPAEVADVADVAPRPEDGAPAVLIIYPLGDAEPSPAQRVAASELGSTDVATFVRDPLPRLERAGTRGEMRALATRLRSAGLDARATAPPATAPPRPIQRAKLDGSTLTLTGPDGEVAADVTKPTFLVVGRGADGRTRYLHVYAGGRPAPFEVHERTGLPGFLTQPQPFQAFTKAVQQAGVGVSMCDLLLVHGANVEQATLAVELPEVGPKTVASARAVALSRVLYETWLDGLSIDPATLEHCVRDKKATPERASGRQPRPERAERPSGRLPQPPAEVDNSAFTPPPAHMLRGTSIAAQVSAATPRVPPAQGGGADALAALGAIGEKVKALGSLRLMAGAALGVLAFLVYIFIETGSGIVWRVKEDPAHGETAERNTIRIVVQGDNNLPTCVDFKLKVLGSKQVKAVAPLYVWQDDREEPRNGGYDRGFDSVFLQPGNGKLPFIYIYNAKKQIMTGIRGASDMTPEQLVAFLAAAKADPRSGEERQAAEQQ